MHIQLQNNETMKIPVKLNKTNKILLSLSHMRQEIQYHRFLAWRLEPAVASLSVHTCAGADAVLRCSGVSTGLLLFRQKHLLISIHQPLPQCTLISMFSAL